MKNLVIFASGNGSNAQNIIEHFNNSNTARVKAVICNKPDAYVLKRAEALNTPHHLLTREELTSSNPQKLLQLLDETDTNYIILAGYLLKIPQALVEKFPHRIINIHPALLPKFGGKGMYGLHVHQAVIDAQEKETGITIHLVDAHYDSGEPLFQAKCPVFPTDTPEGLQERVQQLEKEHFARTIEEFISK